jgi:glycosyltransferase involved in cell wall biosynthesis
LLEQLEIPVTVTPAFFLPRTNWELYHFGLRALEDEFNLWGAERVYANTNECFWAIDLAERMELPSVWCIHESEEPLSSFPQLDPRLRVQFLERLSAPRKMLFVAQSSADLFADYLRGEQITVIPNGVDVDELERRSLELERHVARERLGIGRGETVVSIIGTTASRKGQDTFLRAAARLVRECPQRRFLFLVVGARDGDYLDELRELGEELGLASCLRFVPETREVMPFFRSSDVVVIASRVESAPLVSLEAFALQVPLVTTTSFGLAEQVQDGRNALVFQIGDELGLAQQVRRVLENPELRRRLVEAAYRDVHSRFRLEACLKQHLAALRDLKNQPHT